MPVAKCLTLELVGTGGEVLKSGTVPEFPRWGGGCQSERCGRKTYYLAKSCKNLREKERNWTARCEPLGPPASNLLVPNIHLCFHWIQDFPDERGCQPLGLGKKTYFLARFLPKTA